MALYNRDYMKTQDFERSYANTEVASVDFMKRTYQS